MSVIDLPTLKAPNIVVMNLRGQTAVYESPMTAGMQTLDRGGFHWKAVYTWTNIQGDARADMLGTIAALRAQANRLRVPVYDNPKRGAYGGTPVVDGVSQVGSTLNVRGCSNSITNWIRKGDYFSVIVNGEPELKMATADASSGGTGLITLSFEPRLRFSPADGNSIYVDDDVLPKPQGVFVLTAADQNWSSQPSLDGRSAVSLDMTEDVFASKP